MLFLNPAGPRNCGSHCGFLLSIRSTRLGLIVDFVIIESVSILQFPEILGLMAGDLKAVSGIALRLLVRLTQLGCQISAHHFDLMA